jgi:hypothetical protein
MSDGFIHWYLNEWSPRCAQRFVASLREAGIVLANPETKSAAWITNGPESYGEQVFVPAEELVEKLRSLGEGEINFQLWLDATTDVFTRVRKDLTDGVAVELSLDGLTYAEQTHVIAALVDVVDKRTADTAGFVVDRLGVTADVDWEAAVGGQPVVIPAWPDVLGLLEGHQVTCREPSPGPSRRQGRLILMESPDLLR